MRAWPSFGAISLLFVVPACGTVGRREVTQSPAPVASVGASTDAGERWLGAEPIGGLVVETAPRLGAASPRPPAPPAARSMAAPPVPVAPQAPAPRPGNLRRTPPPPPPPAWPKTPPLPPPPGSAAAWQPAAREPMPPPVIEHVGSVTTSDGARPGSLPVAIHPSSVQLPPGEMVEWAPVGTRNPHAGANDSASLEGPPSGILPPPVVKRRN